MVSLVLCACRFDDVAGLWLPNGRCTHARHPFSSHHPTAQKLEQEEAERQAIFYRRSQFLTTSRMIRLFSAGMRSGAPNRDTKVRVRIHVSYASLPVCMFASVGRIVAFCLCVCWSVGLSLRAMRVGKTVCATAAAWTEHGTTGVSHTPLTIRRSPTPCIRWCTWTAPGTCSTRATPRRSRRSRRSW